MESKIARFLSVLLHPVFIPLIAAVIVFRLGFYPFSFYAPKAMYVVLAIVFIFNVVTPVFFIYLFKKSGIISSFTLDERRDRILPLFAYALMLYLSSVIFRQWDLPQLWHVILLLTAMLTLFVLLISVFSKISFHLSGWGGLTGMIMFLIYAYGVQYFLLLSAVVFCAGLAAWSRATLEKHKAGEIITGFIMACLIMFSGLYLIF
jgi:hypothetical protein